MIKIVSLLIVIVFTIGCSSSNIKHVGKKEFMDKAQGINQMNTVHKTIYIGDTKNHIFIRHWNNNDLSMKGKYYIYVTQRKFFTDKELNELSLTRAIDYIGIWQNKKNPKDLVTIENNGGVKPWKATWDLTQNNGIIIIFKNENGVDIIKAQLNKAGELIILTGSNPREYIKELPPKVFNEGFNFEAL